MKKNQAPISVQEKLTDIKIVFIEKRFTVKHLSQVADRLNATIITKNKSKDKRVLFDLSNLEWVGHEELVFLSALFHHLFINKYDFFIQLRGTQKPNKRQALQIIQLWDNWNISSFVPQNEKGFRDIDRYFDIDPNYISFLKRDILKHKKSLDKTIFNGFTNITPFYSFEILPRIDEKLLSQELEDIHLLDEHTEALLMKYKSDTLFF